MPVTDWNILSADGDTGFQTLHGFNITETAGAVAQVRIRDGNGGDAVFDIKVLAGTTVGDIFGDEVITNSGQNWYFDLVSGAVSATIFGG